MTQVGDFVVCRRTKGNTLGFVITFDEPMQEMCSSTGEVSNIEFTRRLPSVLRLLTVASAFLQVVPVQRREPVRPAAMIKSCYPTFEKKHKDLKLQLLPVSDRWVNCFAAECG